MNVIEITTPGGPDALRLSQRATPRPAANELLVKVAAAGINGPDMIQRRGHYPPPKGASDLLGLEAAGEVVAVGEAVKNFGVGDTVCGLTNGGAYADYVAVDAAHCLPIPDGVSIQDAGGLPETYFTVWSNVFLDHPPQPGQIFLVHGGAGGIGSTAIQLGAALGLHVIATAGSTAGCQWCKELGAQQVVNYREEDFVDVAKSAGGANVILDIIGGDYVARNIKASAPDGRIVQLAFNRGSKVEIDLMPVMLKRLTYTGSTLRSRPAAFKARVANELAKNVWPLFGQNKIRSVTHKTYPLGAAATAHSAMEAGGHHGKLLLLP